MNTTLLLLIFFRIRGTLARSKMKDSGVAEIWWIIYDKGPDWSLHWFPFSFLVQPCWPGGASGAGHWMGILGLGLVVIGGVGWWRFPGGAAHWMGAWIRRFGGVSQVGRLTGWAAWIREFGVFVFRCIGSYGVVASIVC